MSGTLEAVEADLQHALDQVVLAVTRAIPGGNDVIDPQQIVKQWMVQLTPDARARFLMLILSEGTEARLDGIVRAILAGDDGWNRPDPEVVSTPPLAAPQPDIIPEPA